MEESMLKNILFMVKVKVAVTYDFFMTIESVLTSCITV